MTEQVLCALGHRTRAMERPACSGSTDPAWWRWYRSRTTSASIRDGVDAWLAERGA